MTENVAAGREPYPGVHIILVNCLNGGIMENEERFFLFPNIRK